MQIAGQLVSCQIPQSISCDKLVDHRSAIEMFSRTSVRAFFVFPFNDKVLDKWYQQRKLCIRMCRKSSSFFRNSLMRSYRIFDALTWAARLCVVSQRWGYVASEWKMLVTYLAGCSNGNQARGSGSSRSPMIFFRCIKINFSILSGAIFKRYQQFYFFAVAENMRK